MRTLLVSLLLLTVVGCDTVGTDVVPLADVLVVGLDGTAPPTQPTLTFVTEGVPGCATPIAYRTRVDAERLTVEVEGLQVQTGPVCLALIPSRFRVAVPSGALPLDVAVVHRGATDRYEVRQQNDAYVLVAVETSTTRLGPR